MSAGDETVTGRHSSRVQPKDAFGGRISELIALCGGRKRASEVADISPDTLDRYVRGEGKTSFQALESLCVAAGRSMDWLSGRTSGLQPQAFALAEGGFSLIPRYDVHFSSGSGALVLAEDVLEHLAFKESWLRSLGINPRYAGLFPNRGDSNEPTIPNGALLLLDLSIQEVRNGFFYGLRRGDELVMKRVQIRMDGTVILISDNPRYEQEEIPSDLVPELHVVGQLKWFGRSI